METASSIIVLASGVGSRFGTGMPKQFAIIAGKTILAHTLNACDCGLFEQIVLVVAKEYLALTEKIVQSLNISVPIDIVIGGNSRIESCKNGLMAVQRDEGFVVVHNAAQPLVRKETFAACLNALKDAKAVVSAIPSTYVIMKKGLDDYVKSIPDRSELYVDMGVEGFHIRFLREFFALPNQKMVSASVVGNIIKLFPTTVKIYPGDPGNIKITYASDALLAEAELIKREQEKR